MEPRVSLITLGVTDLKRATAFYRDGLGWPVSAASAGDVVFLQLANGLVLSLFPHKELVKDAGLPAGQLGGFGMTLAQNVREPQQVDETLAQAQKAGAHLLKPAVNTDWGGRSGYFADPEGFVWEVAWNPHFPMTAEGGIRLP